MWWLILVGVIAVTGYTVSVYRWPYRRCPKCGGNGRNPGSNEKRHGQCRRCLGAGRLERLGAKRIHRGAVSLADRARRKERNS